MVVDGVAGRKHDGVNASDSLHTHLRVVSSNYRSDSYRGVLIIV